MSHRPRCAIGGIAHESNTFSRNTVRLEDLNVYRGPELPADDIVGPHTDIEWLPILAAWATPSGPVGRSAYEAVRDELLEGLRSALPLDGVLLTLHGAMWVEDLGDGETDLIGRVREVVGPEAPISAALDLHANLSEDVVADVNALTAYRTAPHDDGRETRQRAAAHLARAVLEGIRPVTAMVKLPMLLSGEWAVTANEPARSLYASLPEIESLPGMLDASICIGCAWTDSPETSVSVLAVAEGDADLAHRHAVALAREVWGRREEFGPACDLLGPDEAIAAALQAPVRPVFVSDTGDNPTAGGGGDTPVMLERLVAAGAEGAVVTALADREAVAICLKAGCGARVALELGGKLDPDNAAPLPVEAIVRHVAPPDTAVVTVDGIDVVLCSHRQSYPSEGVLEAAGIDIAERQVAAIKCGYLHGPGLRVARKSVWALTPGYTDLQLSRLPYRRLRRPIFPLDAEVTFGV